ncbi:MAG: hypothetical protein Q4G69_13915 [Planctomycetia bacterium]|nr:hypothetical protein [Planctomycetia bacterium]
MNKTWVCVFVLLITLVNLSETYSKKGFAQFVVQSQTKSTDTHTRVWTAKTGNKLEATWKNTFDDDNDPLNVFLAKENTLYKIPLNQLCEKDQIYVKFHRNIRITEYKLKHASIADATPKFVNVEDTDKSKAKKEYTDIFEAVLADDVEAVKKMVQNGVNVNQGDSQLRTPLHCARSGKMVRTLLELEANIHTKDKYDVKPIYRLSDRSAIVALIEAGANIEEKDEYGYTPLLSAETPEQAQALLDNGANINAKNGLGGSVLHSIQASCSPELCKFFLDKGVPATI